MALPSCLCAHLFKHLRPRMLLKCQRLLRSGGVHPIGDEPIVVAVRITGPPLAEHAGQPRGSDKGGPNLDLSQPVRIIAGDQQDLAGDVGFGRSGEGRRYVARIDCVDSAVGRQRALEGHTVGTERAWPSGRRSAHRQAAAPPIPSPMTAPSSSASSLVAPYMS